MTKDQEAVAELLERLLGQGRFEKVKVAELRDRSHPVRSMLDSSGTNLHWHKPSMEALEVVSGHDPKWLEGKARELGDVSDYTQPAAALAEVRAYAALLDCGFAVAPIAERKGESTPDFRVQLGGSEHAEVEVYTRQLNHAEAVSLRAFHEQKPPEMPPGSITMREHSIAPFGKPRPGESTTENVISKLSAVKKAESQFSDSVPSLLWLDFQDEPLRLFALEAATQPFTEDRSGFFSGPLWYALYGAKSLPIFERFQPRGRVGADDFGLGYVEMRHEGRYRRATRVDAVVVYGVGFTAVLENPWSKTPLADEHRRGLQGIALFNAKGSWLAVEHPHRLAEEIEWHIGRIMDLWRRG